jgi:hypothetical protein
MERVLWVMGIPQRQIPEIYALPMDTTLDELGPFIEINPGSGPFELPGDRLLVGTVDRQALHVLTGPPIAIERTIPTGEVSFLHKSADSLWWHASGDTTWSRLDVRTLNITNLELPSDCQILSEVDGVAYFGIPVRASDTVKIAKLNLSSGDMEVLHTLKALLYHHLLGGGFLWVEAWPPIRVIQIDMESGDLVAEIPLNDPVTEWHFHRGALWVRHTNEIGISSMARIDPTTSQVTAVTFGAPESVFYFGDDAIWMLRGKELWRWGLVGTE